MKSPMNQSQPKSVCQKEDSPPCSKPHQAKSLLLHEQISQKLENEYHRKHRFNETLGSPPTLHQFPYAQTKQSNDQEIAFLEHAQPSRPGARLLMPLCGKYIHKMKNGSLREGGMGRSLSSKFQISRSINIHK